MKKTSILAITALIVLLSAGQVFAHPPKAPPFPGQILGDLTVTAEHASTILRNIMVLTFTVFEGNKQVLLKQYDDQGDAKTFSDSVILKGLKPGSSVRVQLVCNIMGSAESEITID
jgi:hypothetical protein